MDDHLLERYSRQIMLPQIDIEGQLLLAKSHTVIIGLGGLGSPAALYLAAAGIGRLTLIDKDQVELSNLHRQILYRQHQVGHTKTQSALDTLSQINENCDIETQSALPDEKKLAQLFSSAQVVLDCTDNFLTRILINKTCLKASIPLVSAACIRLESQIAVYRHDLKNQACYQCLFPDLTGITEHCATSGVLGPVLGIAGSIQALEAIKLITRKKSSLSNQLLIIDAQMLDFRKVKLVKDPACPTCGNTAS